MVDSGTLLTLKQSSFILYFSPAGQEAIDKTNNYKNWPVQSNTPAMKN